MSCTIRRAERPDFAAWSAFNARSNNGTLFHDLNFIAYHPTDRFETHHLVGEAEKKIEFLLPAGLVLQNDKKLLTSPIGASIGGPVLKSGIGLLRTIEVIKALQNYVRDHTLDGVDITLPPSLYQSEPSDNLAFALFVRGFRLESRRLTHIIDLCGAEERYRTRFRSSMASNVRAMRREGSEVVEGGIEILPSFKKVFEDTYKRHGATATHSLEEITDLLTRFPTEVRLFLSTLRGEPTAGVLLMQLNSRVAYSFYICRSDKHPKAQGNLLIFATLLDRLGDHGVKWLDLGPSARLDNVNSGVTFFKEGIGGVGFCRDRWVWQT